MFSCRLLKHPIVIIVGCRPSPSLKHKQIPMEETSNDQRSDEFSSGSLAGSINSGSSGFGSLPKKRTPLPAGMQFAPPKKLVLMVGVQILL